MKANLYTYKGVKAGTFALPKVFSEKENDALLAQSVRVFVASGHTSYVTRKTRSEVVATKKKIYRQKGTGRARHGAKSAPIFVGGGLAHGPTGIKRQLTLPQKMSQKALGIALSLKAKRGEIVVVSAMDKITKTKDANILLSKLAGDGRVLVALSEKNKSTRLFLKNISRVSVVLYKNLNAHKVLSGGILVIDKEVFSKGKSEK